MKRKGFTLIELLAVIVVLAIIALIATPIVMNVISNVQEGAAERSAERYLDAVEIAVMNKRLDGPVADGLYIIQDDGSLCLEETTCTNETKLKVEVSGNIPTSGGKIAIQNGQVVNSLSTDSTKKTTITIGEYTITLDTNNNLVVEKTGEVVKDASYYGLIANISENSRAVFTMSSSRAQNVPTGFFKEDGDFAYIGYASQATMTFDEFKNTYNDYLMEVAKFVFDNYELDENWGNDSVDNTSYESVEEYFYLEGATNATIAEGILFKKNASGKIEIVGSYCNV